MARIERAEPGPGQESVWDYPRPPRLEAVTDRLRVLFNGRVLADSEGGYRVLETSHPPTYYIPLQAVQTDLLRLHSRTSFCEWKGSAHYFDIVDGNVVAPQAAWGYRDPNPDFAPIRDHVAFYAQHMEACFVGDERVQTQEGDFYGGWITSKIVGPFKGAPGTRFW